MESYTRDVGIGFSNQQKFADESGTRYSALDDDAGHQSDRLEIPTGLVS
ncbi:MAG: hypothetical protein U0V02_11000 [Anaerolineales bacterium]